MLRDLRQDDWGPGNGEGIRGLRTRVDGVNRHDTVISIGGFHSDLPFRTVSVSGPYRGFISATQHANSGLSMWNLLLAQICAALQIMGSRLSESGAS